MDTRKFIFLISALTAVICALTVVYNFASMPAYGDAEVSAVALYTSVAVPSSSSVSVAASSSSRVSVAVSSAVSSEVSSASTTVTNATKTSSKAKSKSSSKSNKTATTSNPVNLNTATAAQLETVPYIGPSRAKVIIAYRNAHGTFKTINDLDNVKGFGKKMIAKVSPYLTTTTT